MRIVKLDENTRAQALAKLIGRGASGYGEYEKTVADIIDVCCSLMTTPNTLKDQLRMQLPMRQGLLVLVSASRESRSHPGSRLFQRLL